MPGALRPVALRGGAAGGAAAGRLSGWRTEEPAYSRVELRGTLELGHVAAVELAVARRGQPLAHVAGGADRHAPLAAGPHEERLGRQLAQPLPELARVLEGDVARGRVERHTPARREVGAQELVQSGRHEVR